jgi:hypothetical protein
MNKVFKLIQNLALNVYNLNHSKIMQNNIFIKDGIPGITNFI